MDDLISKQAAIASIKALYPDMPIVDNFGERQKWLKKYAPYFECENAIEQLQPAKPPTEHCIKRKKDPWIGDKPHAKDGFVVNCCSKY